MKLDIRCLLSAVAGGLIVAGFSSWQPPADPSVVSPPPRPGESQRLPEYAADGTHRAKMVHPHPGPQQGTEVRLVQLGEPDRQARVGNGPQFGGGNATEAPLPEWLTPDERVAVMVYERVNRSVVNINTQGTRNDNLFSMQVPSEGAGSGSVIDNTGHILTNYHVIEGANKINVTLYDGKSYEAMPVGADPINDVAVIKIEAPAESLHPVSLGDSTKLRVGMHVYAIGNPFGLERTLTTGIISSLNRSLAVRKNRTIKSIIQIDAAINPGSSGGPLLNGRGELIGMNTAIASSNGQNAGVGFAIPVALVRRIVPELIVHGKVIRPDSGILRVFETGEGLLIAQLAPGGPAEKAGLRGPLLTRRRRGPFVYETIDRSAADLIVGVDGETISTADEFLQLVESHPPGDTVRLTVVRDGQRVTVPVTLGRSD